MEKTAAIIHGRTRYGDYREKLLVHPADLTEKEVYVWKQRLLQCTKEPEEMRAGHQVRRAVLCDGRYLILGVAAYFRDLYPGSFEDEGRRPVYGFVGFVWKREEMSADTVPVFFPAPQDFAGLVEQYVIPRWEEPKNGPGAENPTLSDYREYGFCPSAAVLAEQTDREAPELADIKKPETGETLSWAADAVKPVDVLPEEKREDEGLLQALRRAGSGETVFYCTGLPAEAPAETAPSIYPPPAQPGGARRGGYLLYARCLCGAAVLLLSLAAALFLPSVPGKLTAGIMSLFFLYRVVQNLRQIAEECRGGVKREEKRQDPED